MARATKAKAAILQFEREKVYNLEELELNSKNNRITHLTIKTEELENILWQEGKLQSLYNDIMNRGLQEPLVLYPKTTLVAEGNCRLLCLKRLHKDAIKSNEPRLQKFKKISVLCKRIVKDTPTADIDAYLTEIHVGRKKKWPEYNQAKLLYKLKHRDNLPLEEIAAISRSSRPTVTRKINCYTFTKQYHQEIPQDMDYVKKFYFFWEFQHPDLEEFRKKPSNIKKFMKWVYYGKFPISKDVRELPKVLKNSKAFAKFESKNMEEAIKILVEIDPTIRSPLYRKINAMTLQLKKFSREDILDIVDDEPKKNIIFQLRQSATELLKYIDELERKNKKEKE